MVIFPFPFCSLSFLFNLKQIGCWVNGAFPYSLLRSANVQGTIETIKLASLSPRFSRYCYVSSLSVFPQRALSSEKEQPAQSSNFLLSSMSGYGSSKRVSEVLLFQAHKLGLPLSVVRPGTICGSSQFGRCNPNDFITKYLQTIAQLGIAPDLPQSSFSMVCVDFVSRVVLLAALLPLSVLSPISSKMNAPVFHTVGQEGKEISLSEISKAARLSGHSNLGIVSYKEWVTHLMLQTDPEKCALVHLKGYFRSGFPAGSDGCVGVEHTLALWDWLKKKTKSYQNGMQNDGLGEICGMNLEIKMSPELETVTDFFKNLF